MIEKYSFGRMRIMGQNYTDDLKIIKGRVIPGWWRQNGHRVLVEDVQDILDAQPEYLVIGRGRPGLLRVDPGLRSELEEQGPQLIELSTARAVQEFNRLYAEGRNVAAGFHLSC
ncbi:Mth938-like domain-containing protein [Desulfonatronovibrio hydrogenovorans]|uniref:Mth938-like domain-containing protein n=1 Tax=Desulfonatronovibrio hydrogenovorans TaxID=53245 RepID=UPI000490AD96|nr:MTH938/NDUFAF3 family protein [Desulfonatronovibrio hydrogenovorans]